MVLLIAGALTLAACGSSSSSSSSATSATSPAAGTATAASSAASSAASDAAVAGGATAAAGTAIPVGSICSCSGVQAASAGKVADATKAWAAEVNAGGGVNGHPVKLYSLDDGADPAKALQDAKQLVEQDKVIAIVGEVSVADEAFADYVKAKAVPVVGGLTIEAPFATNSDFYPTGPGAAVLTVASLQAAKSDSRKAFGAMYCAESPVCAQFVPLAQLAGQLTGLSVHSAKVSSSAPSYTAPCLELRGQGVDNLLIATNGTVETRIVDACAQNGFKPLVTGDLITFAAQFLADPAFEGSVWAAPGANYLDNSVPGVKAFTAAMNTYAPGLTKSPQYNADLLLTYTGGKLFQAAAKAAGGLSPTSTPADVVKGLDALKGETLDGLTAPLTFTAGQPSFPTCYTNDKLTKGTLVTQNATPICLPQQTVAALAKALAG